MNADAADGDKCWLWGMNDDEWFVMTKAREWWGWWSVMSDDELWMLQNNDYDGDGDDDDDARWRWWWWCTSDKP